MPQCPACQSILEHDFGMITCGHCKAVLMVELSGQVHMGNETPPPIDENTFADGATDTNINDDFTESPEETQSSTASSDEFEATGSFDNELENEQGETQFPEEQGSTAETGFDPIANDFNGAMEEEEEASESDFAEDGEDDFLERENSTSASEEFFGDDDQPLEDEEDSLDSKTSSEFVDEGNEYEDEVVEEFPLSAEPDPDPVDITGYANSEESNLEDGEFLYDVKISRLDSRDLKEALKYVLIDEKLKLNHHEYLKKIKDGKVTIANLNPIKAKRIVEQLQYLDIEVKWKQKRVVMAVIEPDLEDDDEESSEGASV